MGSRKGINIQWRSIQWRMFTLVVITFWSIIVCMAWWQVHRVSDLKKDTVYEQLALIGDRLVDIYNHEQDSIAFSLITFVNRYYQEAHDYDPMSVQVRDANGQLIVNYGPLAKTDFTMPNKTTARGIIKVKNSPDMPVSANSANVRYLYYMAHTNNGEAVSVFLPYTKEVGRLISASTTKFWILVIGIAILATIFAYLASHYISRNIKILRTFARNAANDPTFMGHMADFPHDELGDISRQIVTIYDQRMSEMQQREHEHKVALHAVEEKNRIKRELTGNINHELKTPVGVIQGYIDTLVENPEMDPDTRDRFLLKTQENVHRLTSLIQDITAITRLESGDKLVNVTDVDFHDLVFTFENFIEEGNVLQGKLTFSYDVPLPCRVLANESLLHSVLLNLVKNAVAYSQGTMCRLELTQEDDKFYYFRFYDNGNGVAPEHLPHMFERFYRVNSGRSRDCGGTGLGLSIVEVTIKSFGGSIDVQNHYPSGLEFNFTLPKYRQKFIPSLS